jgi:nitrite reductase/ring-hydroxylating ferredoxin subunit
MPCKEPLGQLYLCPQHTVVEGESRGFDPFGTGRDTLLIVRWRGQLTAWRNRCPHLDVAMQYRKDRYMSGDGQRIVCFAHGALFRPDTGLCVLGPCLGQSLQPQRLRVDEKGDVWLVIASGHEALEVASGPQAGAPTASNPT